MNNGEYEIYLPRQDSRVYRFDWRGIDTTQNEGKNKDMNQTPTLGPRGPSASTAPRTPYRASKPDVPTSYTTKNGTQLPLMNIRGKPYLQVAHRLIWFREDHPAWRISTRIVSGEVTSHFAVVRAEISDSEGTLIASAHKLETEKGFPDFLEKAETGAIGRALALIGYGTQFCADELNEGNRLADSPTQPARKESSHA